MASSTALLALALAALLVAAVHADTACQRARARDQKNSTPYVVHECDGSGAYAAKQRTVGTPHWYWCYSPDGEVLLGPSRKIESCACPSAALQARGGARSAATGGQAQAKGGAAEPRCDATGRFEKQQSDASAKWCVNRDTGAVTKQKVPKNQPLTC